MSLSPPRRHELIWRSAADIARLVSAGEVSAIEVLDAHLAQIQAVDPRLNAVVLPLFDQARRDAAALDAARRDGISPGPLAGVPITVKDCYHVAGAPSTMGLGRHRDRVAQRDGPLVARLKAAGAVVVGKTNVPQLMIYYETDNPIFGRTNNPWHVDRSPGGSSGGEAAIIAAGGVPLGLGSDLGGSIRQPAHSCGIHGLKPTATRLTNTGCATTLNGMGSLSIQPGPMARHVDDLALAMRVLTDVGDRCDADSPPMPWCGDRGRDVAGLRVAMWADDGYFSPSPAIRRAVHEAAEALRQAGAVVESFTPPEVAEAVAIYCGIISADGANDFRRLAANSPTDWRVTRLLRLGGMPRSLRGSLAWALDKAGQRRRAALLRQTGALSADEYWQLNVRRTRFAERFMAALDAGGFDAMLCAPFALPALVHGSSLDVIAAGSYCFLPNLLGAPAGVVSVTRVRPGEESDRPASRDVTERTAARIERGSAGFPVGVQLAARPWREDIVLAAMRVVEAYFANQPNYPARPPLE